MPIVSNNGTAYYLAKHLVSILAPLSKIEYTFQNTNDFVNFIKPKEIPSNYQLISFDVSLFTNVPINATIETSLLDVFMNLKKLTNNYKNYNYKNSIRKKEIRELILLFI